VHRKSGIYRAVKILRKELFDEEELADIVNEVGTLKTLDHPNILKVFDLYEDVNCFYIVSELCTGGELFDKIIDKGYLDE